MVNNNTFIVLRISGFYAAIERRLHVISEAVPLLVCAGGDDRALILSACPRALAQGARPGMRVGDLHRFRGEIIEASPEKYLAEEDRISDDLENELPDIMPMRAGVFRAEWSSGRRFLNNALHSASLRLRDLGYRAAWGIAQGDAAAEIAAAVAPTGDVIAVDSGNTRTFLAPLTLELLHDLTPTMRSALAEMGVRTFGQLAMLPDEVLRSMFGGDGAKLRRLAVHGIRGKIVRQWRGRRSLDEDSAEISEVREALASLVSEGFEHVLTVNDREPRKMRLTLLYADGVRTGSQIQSTRPEHEGSWQRLALEQIDRLWTRRVRIAELRLSVEWGDPLTEQLSLFTAPCRQFRDRQLTYAIGRLRTKWGRSTIRFANSA